MALLEGVRRGQEDRGVLRWGGLAGLGGAVVFVAVFVIVGVFVGSDPAGPAGPITRFPEIRTARTVENGLYLAGLVLWVPLALGLGHGVRRTRPASATFGTALLLLGLTVLAAGAIPHVVTSGLAERYHAAGVTAAEQATLVLQWQATASMFDALLLVGLLVMPVGIIILGSAMLRTPAFGTVAAGGCVVLGVAGLAAAIVMLIDPRSPAAALGVLALIGFHLIAGWQIYRLSRTAPA
jgi:hypothetical protein